MDSFTRAELRKLRSLKDPNGIQRCLDDMPYHLADTSFSPRIVLRENTSHCFEGAMFAAAALCANGYPPLILDLEAENDTDHVIAITPDAAIANRYTVACVNSRSVISMSTSTCAANGRCEDFRVR
jgi:hypothetical protein